MAKETIRLVDLVDPETSLIERRTFEDVRIVGPAVLAPIKDVTISECTFEAPPEAVFIEVPRGKHLVGVIGLEAVTFQACDFHNVAIVATAEDIRKFREGFAPPPYQTAEPAPV
jgi:hypothetical protein